MYLALFEMIQKLGPKLSFGKCSDIAIKLVYIISSLVKRFQAEVAVTWLLYIIKQKTENKYIEMTVLR